MNLLLETLSRFKANLTTSCETPELGDKFTYTLQFPKTEDLWLFLFPFFFRRVSCQEAFDDESRKATPARGKVVGLRLLHEMSHGGHSTRLGAATVAEAVPVPLLPQLPPVRQYPRPAAHR